MRCACGPYGARREERERERQREGANERERGGKEGKNIRWREEERRKDPDPASKRLDREPKRNKLLHELVAVIPPSVSPFPRFVL